MSSRPSRDRLWGLVLFLAVVLVYSPVWWAGYIWDDEAVVTGNPVIVGPLGLKEIWTTSAADICPLTLTTFWAWYKVWGSAPLAFHLLTVFLHGASAVVLWRILKSLQIPGAWLGATLWALHPVMVESVAWIAELKNTQSGLFFLLAVLFFARWLKARDREKQKAWNWDYSLMLLFAALAIASKSSTVILPVILCLCAWWIEGWKGRAIVAIIPLFLMAIGGGIVSVCTLTFGSTEIPTVMRSWPVRLCGAGDAVWFYLAKLAWPHPLAMIYPQWQIDPENWLSYLGLVAAIVAAFVLWRIRATWGRPWFFAFAWFLVALLPILGLINTRYFYYSLVADHFQYLAAMGPLALIGAVIAHLGKYFSPKQTWLRMSLGTGVVVILGIVSWQKAWAYENEKALWTDTLKGNPDCWVGYNFLGTVDLDSGRFSEAIAKYQKALALNPEYAGALCNLGNAFLQQGDIDAAIAEYQKTLSIDPAAVLAYNGLGVALAQEGKLNDAILQFQEALRRKPDDVSVQKNLAHIQILIQQKATSK